MQDVVGALDRAASPGSTTAWPGVQADREQAPPGVADGCAGARGTGPLAVAVEDRRVSAMPLQQPVIQRIGDSDVMTPLAEVIRRSGPRRRSRAARGSRSHRRLRAAAAGGADGEDWNRRTGSLGEVSSSWWSNRPRAGPRSTARRRRRRRLGDRDRRALRRACSGGLCAGHRRQLGSRGGPSRFLARWPSRKAPRTSGLGIARGRRAAGGAALADREGGR